MDLSLCHFAKADDPFFNDSLLFHTAIVYPGMIFVFFVLCSLGVFVLNQNHVHNLHKESE